MTSCQPCVESKLRQMVVQRNKEITELQVQIRALKNANKALQKEIELYQGRDNGR